MRFWNGCVARPMLSKSGCSKFSTQAFGVFLPSLSCADKSSRSLFRCVLVNIPYMQVEAVCSNTGHVSQGDLIHTASVLEA